MTNKTRRILVTRNLKFEEASIVLNDVKKDYSPLYLENAIRKTCQHPRNNLKTRRKLALKRATSVL